MKYLLLVLVILIFWSCSTPITKSEFSNKAELRRFKVETTTSKTSSGYLFFFVGGYNSSESSYSKIKFYAKNKLNEYCLFELSQSSIKIRLDSTVNNAYVNFKYNESLLNGESSILTGDSLSYNTIKYLINNYSLWVDATIVCNPKDFPENINLNQL